MSVWQLKLYTSTLAVHSLYRMLDGLMLELLCLKGAWPVHRGSLLHNICVKELLRAATQCMLVGGWKDGVVSECKFEGI